MIPDRIQRPEAKVLAEEEFRRFAVLVGSLTDNEWTQPTDCTAWDVRKMALHVLGSGDAQASFPQFLHQLRRGMPLNKQIDSHHWVDGLNELQIRERSHLSDAEIVTQLSTVGPRAVKGRWGTPLPMRYLHSRSVRPSAGHRSSISSTSASRATCGPTGSTSVWPRAARWSSPRITTVASSPTSSASGPRSMGKRSN